MSFIQKRFGVLFCFVSIMTMMGCASNQYGQQITQVEYYQDCYEPIQHLRTKDKTVVSHTIAGGVIGGVLGGLAGALATGKVEGALVGATAGAVSGAGLGYAQAKQQSIADDNARMASYLKDIDGDIEGLNIATASARAAHKCYLNKFNTAIANYKSGKISKIELQYRYKEISDGCKEAEQILGHAINDSYNKEKVYRDAINEESKRLNIPHSASQPPVTSTLKRTTTRYNTSSVQTKHKLNDVSKKTDRYQQHRKEAEQEQADLKRMQEDMDSTFATITA